MTIPTLLPMRSMRVASLAAAALVSFGCASSNFASPPPAQSATPTTVSGQITASAALQQLFADEWEVTLQENPIFATSLGDRRFNDRLPTVGLADVARRAEQTRGFLGRLESIDRSALTPREQVSYDVFRRLLEEDLQSYEFEDHLIPITNREGFHVFFPQLPDRLPLETVEDYENYVARLNGFHEYTRQHIELMREGMRRGMTLPRVVLGGVEDVLEPHVVSNPTESLLWAPFADFPESFSAADRARLEQAGRDAILTSVVPGYREFLDFMVREYIPGARTSIGASELPDGRAYYGHLVRAYTTLDITPDEVHEIGLEEVARIRAEMEEVIRGTEFDGSFEEFIEFLRTDRRFYVETPEELLRHTSLVLKRMDGKLPELFGRLPRMSYGIREIPEFIAPRTTTAYYGRPAGDGTRSGTYWVNTYDLDSRPLYEIEALSFHEAVPGHHIQIALQQELDSLPEFRQFAGFTAFVEGWALYAERLGLETGFYEDPYSNFGRLTYEMWRACRLVVDTGMHAKGWTRQQAIDYMAENTALTMLNIENEVDRYIAWPGQALAYKMGELKIRELRQLAEQELGEGFDLREFHDVVLGSGAVPLTVLEDNVRRFIADRAAR